MGEWIVGFYDEPKLCQVSAFNSKRMSRNRPNKSQEKRRCGAGAADATFSEFTTNSPCCGFQGEFAELKSNSLHICIPKETRSPPTAAAVVEHCQHRRRLQDNVCGQPYYNYAPGLCDTICLLPPCPSGALPSTLVLSLCSDTQPSSPTPHTHPRQRPDDEPLRPSRNVSKTTPRTSHPLLCPAIFTLTQPIPQRSPSGSVRKPYRLPPSSPPPSVSLSHAPSPWPHDMPSPPNLLPNTQPISAQKKRGPPLQ